MQSYALIINGVVTEIIVTSRNIATMFHKGLEWRDITGVTVTVAPQPAATSSSVQAGAVTSRPVRVGDVVSGNGFAPPVVAPTPIVPTIQHLQAEIVCLEARVAKLEASRH